MISIDSTTKTFSTPSYLYTIFSRWSQKTGSRISAIKMSSPKVKYFVYALFRSHSIRKLNRMFTLAILVCKLIRYTVDRRKDLTGSKITFFQSKNDFPLDNEGFPLMSYKHWSDTGNWKVGITIMSILSSAINRKVDDDPNIMH